MSRRLWMALRVGLPAVAVVVAFTISLVAALSSSAAPARPSARPTLPLHPQPAPPGSSRPSCTPRYLRAGPRAQAGAGGEDRQHRDRAAADRAAVGRSIANPVLGGLMVLRGRRAG